jgi:hypothetical protein
MSTYWSVSCKACNESSSEYGNGEFSSADIPLVQKIATELQSVENAIAFRETLERMEKLNILTCSILYYYYVLKFILRHADHDLQLKSENQYDPEIPLTIGGQQV